MATLVSFQAEAQQDLSPYHDALTMYRNGNCTFFTAEPSSIPVSCNGENDGGACISIPTDGVGPYDFIWVSLASDSNCITGVDAGTYTVIVIDQGQGGASCSWDIIVNEPAPLAVFDMNESSPSCFGVCDGTAFPIVIGGNGGYQFEYDSGEMTQFADELCNPFQLTITDSEGCSIDTTYNFVDAPDSIEINGVKVNNLCSGIDDGSIDITVTGGANSYGFAWTGPDLFASTDEDIFNLAPGDYTVLVTDTNSCQNQTTFTILPVSPILVDALLEDVLCAGDSTGSIDITVSGGNMGYIFEWSGPDGYTAADEDISNLVSGTYDLTITDLLLCEKDTSFFIDQNLPIDITALLTDVECFDEETGAIDASASGPFPILDYSWTGDIVFSGEDLDMIPAGSYTLTVTDDQNCTADSTFEITSPDEIILTMDITDILCAGDSTGAIDLELSGGVETYTYFWTGPGTFTFADQDIVDAPAGDYSVTVTDSNFCTRDSTVSIVEPDPILVLDSIIPVACAGDSTGAVFLTLSGGTGAFTTTWSGPGGFSSSDVDITGLPTGIYDVSILDENLCEFTGSYEVTEPDSISIGYALTHIECFGDSTGVIDFLAIGGTGELTYSWTGPDSFTSVDEDISMLVEGFYTVVITDENLCSKDTTFEILSPDEIILDLVVTDILCFGDSTGAIDLSASGGTGTYGYDWIGPGSFTSSDEDIADLLMGDYTLVVTDENDCIADTTIIILEPAMIMVEDTITNALCAGDEAGAIEIILTGGAGGFMTDWMGPDSYTNTDEDIFDLQAGVYDLIVTDANACEATFSFEVLQPDSIMIDFLVTDVLCNGDSTGAIDIAVTGGILNYEYDWTAPGFTSMDEDVFNLLAGDYVLVVTDDNDCTSEVIIPVAEPDAIVIDTTVTNLPCYGDTTGSILLDLSGGAGGFIVNWSGPDSYTSGDEDIFDLLAGIYTATVIDANNCMEMISVEIIEPDSIQVEGNITQIDCFGDASGAIDITASAGVGEYIYAWLGPNGYTNSIEDIQDLEAGIYTVTVTDGNFCEQDASFEVLENDTIEIVGTAIGNLCAEDTLGSIEIEVTGGFGDFTYLWTGPDGFTSNDEDIFNLASGSYTVVATDALGCDQSAMFIIQEPLALEVIAVLSDPSCFGDMDGDIDITITGGTPDYFIEWIGPVGFSESGIGIDIEELLGGEYFLTITDDLGCVIDTSFILIDPDDLFASVDIIDASCGFDNGLVTSAVSGGTIAADYTYTWLDDIPSEISTDDNLPAVGAGAYTFIVSDDNDCAVIIPFEVSDSVGTIAAQITDVTCFNDMDGAINVVVEGLTGMLTIGWVGPGSYSSDQLDISELEAGDYTITVEDEAMCTLVETYTVGTPDEITILGDALNETCPTEENGAIDITASGGSGDLSYAWTNTGAYSSIDDDIFDLEPDTYTVLVTDTSNCTGTADFTVLPAEDYTVSADITPIDCAGENTGAIDITVSPALTGENYSWAGPGTYTNDIEDIMGLEVGTYNLTITTENFCTIQESYDIVATDSILVELDITNSACGLDIGAVSATVTGGTIAMDYQYSFYSLPDSTAVATSGLDGGLYGYTIMDDNGCSASGTFAISDEQGSLLADVQGVTCEGSDDGAIDLTITGLAGDLAISWVGPDGYTNSIEDVSELAPGFYTVIITDANDCVLGDTYEVLDGVGIAIDGEVMDITCNDDDDGAIDMSFIGGNGLIEVLWNGPEMYTAMTEDIEGLEPGIYEVTITDEDGCEGIESFEVEEPDTIAVVAVITPILCNGEETGAIALDITGGTGQIFINWTGPGPYESQFEDIDGLDAGIYTLNLEDENGCAFTMDYEVNEADPITLTELQFQNSSCNQASGLVEVEAQGGNGPYQYEWTNSAGFVVSSITLADGLFSDTYTVEVRDEDDCIISQDYIISDQDAQLDAVVTNVSCNGLSDGAIDLTITGDVTAPADTLWTGPNGYTATSEDITGLEAGLYTVTITDAATCVFSQSWEVTEPDTILVTGIVTPATCNGDSNGAIDITATGGTGTPAYIWEGPAPFISDEEDIEDLEPGTYIVTVTDIVPCAVQYSFEVGEPDDILVVETLSDPSCIGIDDGSILIDVSGGNGGYAYDWDGPDPFTSNAEDILNVAPGVYDLTVTDDSSCVQTASYELQGVQLIDFVAIASEVLCNGDSVATIDITVSGGNGGFGYEWEGPDMFTSDQEDLVDLFAGTYDVLITDQLGCELDTTVILDEPEALLITLLSLDDVTCGGDSDGAINIETIGGTIGTGYTFAWDGPDPFSADTESIANLEEGEYVLTVTDENMCEAEETYMVDSPFEITVSSSVIPVNCFGDEDGSISIGASGGSGILNYDWTGPPPFTSDQEDLENLAPGIYNLLITDQAPCSATFSFEVLEPDPISITETLLDPSCVGIDDGSIDINVLGGNGGNGFQWTGPDFNSTLEDITGLAPGTYDISIVDDSSCVGSASFTLMENQVIALDLDIAEILCYGDESSIDLTVAGGTVGYIYDWSGPDSFISDQEDIADLEPGDYSLNVEDLAGCMIDSMLTITEPDSIMIELDSSADVSCNGDGDGALTIIVSGGIPEYTIDWDGPDGYDSDQLDISDLQAGQYLVQITDDNDCVMDDSFTVIEPDSLLISVDELIEPECENSPDGSISISGQGGNDGYSYDWIGPNGFDSEDQNLAGLLAGDYLLTVSDALGCIASDLYSISFQTAISVEAGDYPPTCNGDTVALDGQGGPANSDFGWSVPGGPAFTDQLMTTVPISTSSSAFILTVTNGNCVATDTAFIEVLSLPLPDAGEDQEVFFDEIVALGGDPTWADALSYSWSPSEGLDASDVSNPGYLVAGEQLFTVTVVGLNGCEGEDDVLITINPELVVPGGITPNDDGTNDTWMLQNTELFPQMIVRVFNRWGDELWTSTPGYAEEWDGKYEGNDLPVGTYYYAIELNDERFPDPVTGPVTIFR